MNKEELLEQIKNMMMREEPLNINMALKSIAEWDSLSNIGLIALYDNLFGINLSRTDLKKFKTVEDLINIVSERLDVE